MQIKDPIIFVSGLAVGAVGAWLITKHHYRQIADEEIESVKQSFKKLQEDAQKRADAAKNKPDMTAYMEMTKAKEEPEAPETKVINYSGFTSDNEPEEQEVINREDLLPKPIDAKVDRTKPYLINRLPYSTEDPDYTSITVVYYADGTYADSHGTEMEIEDYIGSALMGYIEETDKEELFIRNEELGVDIDIVKDARTYDEIMFG